MMSAQCNATDQLRLRTHLVTGTHTSETEADESCLLTAVVPVLKMMIFLSCVFCFSVFIIVKVKHCSVFPQHKTHVKTSSVPPVCSTRGSSTAIITPAAAAALARDIQRCTGKGHCTITSRWRRCLGGPLGAKGTSAAEVEASRQATGCVHMRMNGERQIRLQSQAGRMTVGRTTRLYFGFHLVSRGFRPSERSVAKQVNSCCVPAGD